MAKFKRDQAQSSLFFVFFRSVTSNVLFLKEEGKKNEVETMAKCSADEALERSKRSPGQRQAKKFIKAYMPKIIRRASEQRHENCQINCRLNKDVSNLGLTQNVENLTGKVAWSMQKISQTEKNLA